MAKSVEEMEDQDKAEWNMKAKVHPCFEKAMEVQRMRMDHVQ